MPERRNHRRSGAITPLGHAAVSILLGWFGMLMGMLPILGAAAFPLGVVGAGCGVGALGAAGNRRRSVTIAGIMGLGFNLIAIALSLLQLTGALPIAP